MCSEEGIHMCVVWHGVLEPKLGGKCFLVRGWLNKESEPKWVEEGINVGLGSDGDGKLVTQREIDQMSIMGAWFLSHKENTNMEREKTRMNPVMLE